MLPNADLNTQNIARDDLILFLNACFACTGQREFYSTADEQRVSMEFLHQYVMYNYRRLYACALAIGVNDFNAANIVLNLLASGKQAVPSFRSQENALLTAAFHKLPPQRSWKLVSKIRAARINNRRTRALLRDFVLANTNLTFHAVKYRRHVRSAAIHARVPLSGELPAFLFNEKVSRFQTPLLETFRRARYSAAEVYNLPYTVARGLATKHGIKPETFLKNIEPRLTERERLALQNKSRGKFSINPAKLPLTALCLYVLSLPITERKQRQTQLTEWLTLAARQILSQSGSLPLPDGKIAAVLDNSYSSSGSSEKKARPLALALATQQLLALACYEKRADFRAFWTHPISDPLTVQSRGQSNLSERLLDSLEWGATTVILISDGVENDPPHTFHAVLKAACQLKSNLTVMHFNPVFDADMLSVRGVSQMVPTVGLRDANDLPTALSFARFAAGQCELAELEEYLAARVATFLGSHNSNATNLGIM